MSKKPDKLDREFETVWASVDEMWRRGEKEDAKYFWLLGCKAANENAIAGFSKARQEVEEAKNALC